jgi:hypothetical protein
MKLRSKVIKVCLVLGILGILAVVSILWRGSSSEGKGSSGMGIFLARPTFAQDLDESFLEKEAGIATYTNLGQKINLTKAKTAFRIVEKESDVYVIGSAPVPGYENDTKEDVHCFVHKDGWVVVYYPNSDPTSKMMYWKNWDGKTISTKLEESLMAVSSVIAGIAATDVKYYHFKYPGANKLMIIANKKSFKLTIPGELAIHERSYDGSVAIDNQSLGSGPGWIALSQLKPDVSHWITGGNKVIVLVYQEH